MIIWRRRIWKSLNSIWQFNLIQESLFLGAADAGNCDGKGGAAVNVVVTG